MSESTTYLEAGKMGKCIFPMPPKNDHQIHRSISLLQRIVKTKVEKPLKLYNFTSTFNFIFGHWFLRWCFSHLDFDLSQHELPTTWVNIGSIWIDNHWMLPLSFKYAHFKLELKAKTVSKKVNEPTIQVWLILDNHVSFYTKAFRKPALFYGYPRTMLVRFAN